MVLVVAPKYLYRIWKMLGSIQAAAVPESSNGPFLETGGHIRASASLVSDRERHPCDAEPSMDTVQIWIGDGVAKASEYLLRS